MFLSHLSLLACPTCAGELRVVRADAGDRLRVLEGTLRCDRCRREFPIVGGVSRFVPRENYASGFGLQWIRHARTQYDSCSGLGLSELRFSGQTHCPRDLKGKVMLEVGSGSGRFTEQAANTGATVVTFDYSYAVDAKFAANGHRENVLVLQADVFEMPFGPEAFDYLFCFGMLQHTPDPARAFAALPRVLKSGGSLCADICKATIFKTLLQTKYYVRPFTRRMDPEKLYATVVRWVDFMWPVAAVIRKLPKGYAINWRLLVADYSFAGLAGQQLKEFSYLDTFDMLAPHYDRPARLGTFRRWAELAGLMDVEAEYSSHGLTLRGRTPAHPERGTHS